MTHPDDLARENAALRARLATLLHTGDMARAQATELRAALECLLAGPTDAAQTRARAALAGDGGATLQSELDAARAVVALARPLGADPAYTDVVPLLFALRAAVTSYDEAMKARGMWEEQ